MTGPEVADLLERLAEKVIQLPGVSRTRPHAFAEAKSELRGEMRQMASELRGVARQAADVGAIPTGPRFVGSRRILVVSRSRRS